MSHDPDEPHSSEPARPPAPDKRGLIRKRVDSCLDLLNSTALQTVLYLIFVLVFQMILEQLRVKEEFYFDKVRAESGVACACPLGAHGTGAVAAQRTQKQPRRHRGGQHRRRASARHRGARCGAPARPLARAQHVMDRFIENHFDSSHNTFDSVRRVADIYEWGNNVRAAPGRKKNAP
eukprot:7033901-Prymnesium_polylepis.1